MKIITNTKRLGNQYYVQVRDFWFMGRLTQNSKVMGKYVSLLNEGHSDFDFIKVSEELFNSVFANCSYIVDFNEYSKDNGEYLSRVLINVSTMASNDENVTFAINYKADGLRDMIAYKRGELDYKIPLVPNGEIELSSTNYVYHFDSTIVNGCYIITTVDGNLDNPDAYKSFLDTCVSYVCESKGIENEDKKVNVIPKDNAILVFISGKTKKKEHKLLDIFRKKKTRN